MKKAYLATLFAAGVVLAASADNNWFAASVNSSGEGSLADASWSAAPTISDNAWQLAGNSPVLSLTKTLDETQTQMDATMSFVVTFDNAYLQSELADVTVPQNAQGGILVAYDANNAGPYYYYRNGSAWTKLSDTAVSDLGASVTVTVKITYSNLQTGATPTIAYKIGDAEFTTAVEMASSPSSAVAAITCGGFGSVASLVGSTDVAVAKKGNEKVTAENLASVFTGSGTVDLLANCAFKPAANGQYDVRKNGKDFTFSTDGVKFETTAGEVTTYRARTSAAFSGGDGSQGSPYQIANATDILELQYFSAGNDFAGKYFSQTANIDLANLGKQDDADVATLSGIANFSGTYDGGNKTISNLKLAAGTYKGLFAKITGATLKNLTMENLSMAVNDGVSEVGAAFFVGYTYGSTLENLTSKGTVTYEGGSFNKTMAGIAVSVATGNSVFKNCTNLANISSSGNKIGGMVGIQKGAKEGDENCTVVFENCVNEGNLTTTGNTDTAGIGGIIGYSQYCVSCKIKNCVNKGVIQSKDNLCLGEFLGYLYVKDPNKVNKFLAEGENVMTANLPAVGHADVVANAAAASFAVKIEGTETYQLPVTVAAGGTYRCTYPNNQLIAITVKESGAESVTIDHAVATYTRNFGDQVVAETVTGTLHQYTAIKGATEDNEWVKKNVPDGKTIQEVMDATQENGNKGFQNFALGLNKADHLKVTAANKSGSNVTLASNAKDNGSGMAVAFKLFKGETEIADGTSLDVTTAAEGHYKIKAFVKGEAVASDCVNEIGLMRPVSAKKSTIVAVPFKNIGTGDINVTDVVNPAVLSEGDTLQVFKGDKFDNYKVIGGVWQAVTTVSKNGASEASGGTIARGSAVILTRTDTSTPIVLLGQYDGSEVTTTIASGSKPVWNLVASPSGAAVDPNVLFGVGEKSDSICIPNDSGAPDMIECNGTEWGCFKKSTGKYVTYNWEKCSSIPAGTGFYYLGRGDRSSIEW